MPIIVGTKYDSEPKPPYFSARLHAPETNTLIKGNMGIDEKYIKRK